MRLLLVQHSCPLSTLGTVSLYSGLFPSGKNFRGQTTWTVSYTSVT